MAAQPDVVRDRQIQAQVQAAPQAQSGDGKSSSRTVTDTIIGMALFVHIEQSRSSIVANGPVRATDVTPSTMLTAQVSMSTQ